MLNARSIRWVALGGLALMAGTVPAAAQVTVDGVIYANFRYGLETDSSFSPAATPNNFDVARSYLNVRSKSAGGISTRVTVDVDGRKADANQLTFRLKYAYVGWTPEGSALTYNFGLLPTPILGFIEDTWGYRMQGTVAIDRNKYLSSSDFGFAVAGAWDDQAVSVDVGVYNGETYSNAPGDNRKDVAGRVSVRLAKTDQGGKTGGLRATGFASYGKSNGGETRQRMLGMLSYHAKALRLGAEYAVTKDDETKGRVMSAWGTYDLTDSPIGLMARVDQSDRDTDIDPVGVDLDSGTQTRLIAGVSYQLAPMVRLLLDADIVSAENGPASNSFEAANRSLYFHTEIKF
jgi:hypothetical protein